MDNQIANNPTTGEEKVLTPEIYRGMFVAALSELEIVIQKLHDAESKLVYNSDNLPKITEFIEQGRKALKVVEEKRTKLKASVLLKGKNIDAGAALIANELNPLINKANDKKQKIAAELAANALILKQAEEKKQECVTLIDNFIIEKTGAIAAAESIETLIYIEKLINLETANEKRYGDQLPDLKARIELIRPLIVAQKESVKELSALNKIAANTDNDESALEAMDKMDEVKEKIQQQRTNILETAVGQASSSSYSQVIPDTPKPSRRQWKYVAIDLPLLYKKNPELVTLSLNDEAVKKLMKDKKEKGELKSEMINGLHIYFDVKY